MFPLTWANRGLGLCDIACCILADSVAELQELLRASIF